MCTVSQRDEDFHSCKWHSLPLNIIVAVNAEALLTQIILSPLFSVSTGRDWAKTISLERAVTFSHIPDVSNTRIASGSPTCYLRFLNHIQMLDRCIDMDVFNQHSLWNGLVAGAAMLVISAFLLRLYFSPFSLVRGAFTRHRIFSPKRHSLVPVCTPYVTRQLAWVWELWQVIVVVAAEWFSSGMSRPTYDSHFVENASRVPQVVMDFCVVRYLSLSLFCLVLCTWGFISNAEARTFSMPKLVPISRVFVTLLYAFVI